MKAAPVAADFWRLKTPEVVVPGWITRQIAEAEKAKLTVKAPPGVNSRWAALDDLTEERKLTVKAPPPKRKATHGDTEDAFADLVKGAKKGMMMSKPPLALGDATVVKDHNDVGTALLAHPSPFSMPVNNEKNEETTSNGSFEMVEERDEGITNGLLRKLAELGEPAMVKKMTTWFETASPEDIKKVDMSVTETIKALNRQELPNAD